MTRQTTVTQVHPLQVDEYHAALLRERYGSLPQLEPETWAKRPEPAVFEWTPTARQICEQRRRVLLESLPDNEETLVAGD
jgi:hypothetical protein